MTDMQNRDRWLGLNVEAAARRLARHAALTVTVVSLATVFGAAIMFVLRLIYGEP